MENIPKNISTETHQKLQTLILTINMLGLTYAAISEVEDGYIHTKLFINLKTSIYGINFIFKRTTQTLIEIKAQSWIIDSNGLESTITSDKTFDEIISLTIKDLSKIELKV